MSGKNKKVIFVTGGGTGGHIYPALAIAKALRDKGCEIFYVGNPKNLEKEIFTKEGFPFLNVDISGMPRKAGFSILGWGLKLIFSIIKSIHYILKYKPDAVFGTGGYVSAPALFASIVTNTPFAIHDCDSVPGVVSKTVAPYAKFVSVAFESSKEYLKTKNIILNGNPIRTEFSTYNKQSAREKIGVQDKLTILVMGGSQGAKTLNNALVHSLPELFCDANPDAKFDVQIIHQTGKKNFDETIAELEKNYPGYKNNKNYIVQPYFDEMYLPLIASDIVVSRAGSLSISEICAAGTASILVPFPYAAADHQRKNAKEMERKKASLYLEDADCNAENLFNHLKKLIENTQELEQLQNSAKACAKLNATENICNELLQIH